MERTSAFKYASGPKPDAAGVEQLRSVFVENLEHVGDVQPHWSVHNLQFAFGLLG
jgi:hypothetical protein